MPPIPPIGVRLSEMSAIPVYVSVRSDALRARLAPSFPDAVPLAHPPRLEELSELAPGLLLLEEAGLSAEELLESASVGSTAPGWVAVALREGAAGVSARTVSVGYYHELGDVTAFAQEPDASPHLLELFRTLREISRARHDLNNPLTSALAEVQILLLDAVDGETRDSLEVIQEQLRRLRDLLSATRHLRARRYES